MKIWKHFILLCATLSCFLSARVVAQSLELKGEWNFQNDLVPSYLVAQGNFAYTLTPNRTLRIIDATDGANPRLASEIPVLATAAHPSSLAVSGNYVYLFGFVAGGSSGRLEIVNVTDPTYPVITSSLVLNGSWGGPYTPHFNIQVSGGYAYLGSDHAMLVIHVADPAAPQQSTAFSSNDRPVFDSHRQWTRLSRHGCRRPWATQHSRAGDSRYH